MLKLSALAGRFTFHSMAALALAACLAGCSKEGTEAEQDAAGAPSTDQIAWEQFILAAAPSQTSGKVTFETWASDQDIYVANPCVSDNDPAGCNSPVWPTAAQLQAPKELTPSVLGLSHQGLAHQSEGNFAVEVIGPAQGCVVPTRSMAPGHAAANSGFPAQGCVGEEVRRDRASFDYIVDEGLWSSAGLTSFFNAKGTVTFPTDALEVKADWIPVTTLATWLNKPQSFVTANFYTASASVTPGGPQVRYALTSMHISVKAAGFPDWIWANFENAYTPGRCDQTGCADSFGAQVPQVAASSTAWGQYGACAKSAAVTQLMKTAGLAPVFANYCMTGTQTTFGTATDPTLLGSPIIEPLNADVALSASSCISCHGGASFNAAGPNFNIGGVGPQSPPAGYIGYDFMWGLLAAQ